AAAPPAGRDGPSGACPAALADAAPGPGGPGVRAALGVVPAGGGNDAARSLGLPVGDPLAAAALLPRLRRRPADPASVARRAYLNVAGGGFDSEVNRIANQRLGWAGNRPRYVGAVLAELAVGRTARFRLTLDGLASEPRGSRGGGGTRP